LKNIEKVILYLGSGIAIFLQWLTIYDTEIIRREVTGIISLMILLLMIIYFAAEVERNRKKRR